MKTFLRERPWLWVWVAFIVLFSAWGTLFTIALTHQPERIPMPEFSSPQP